MNVRSKIIIIIALVVYLTIFGIFYYIAKVQEEQLTNVLKEQAKGIAQSIKLVRYWAAENRELIVPVPAKLTYELAELSNEKYNYKIELKSNKIRNYRNLFDSDFDYMSYVAFTSDNKDEYYMYTDGKFLYAVPLRVEEPCLYCHIDQGYRVGDLRGILIVELPVNEIEQLKKENKRKIFLLALFSALIVSAFLYILLSRFVIEPVYRLKNVAEEVMKGNYEVRINKKSKDEFGKVFEAFDKMVQEIKKRENAIVKAEKLATIGKLTSGISHQINNPLANIMLYAQMHKMETKDKNTIKVLDIIEKEAERIAKVVRSLLEYAKERKLEKRKVKLSDIVESALEILNPMLKNITLVKDLNSKIYVNVDFIKLREAIINILINSIEAVSSREDGKIVIKTYLDSSQNPPKAIIEISDNGIGIPENHLKKIFDPLFSTKKDGTGLGLAITYEIIKDHGGNIKVESEVGKGTKFIIELPAVVT